MQPIATRSISPTASAPDGTLDWTAPPGRWTLHGLFLGWHGKMVERAAPGGEGMVIDHFSRDAIRDYLARFDRAFAGGGARGVRAFFNDSYEVDDAQGQGDGTPALIAEFQSRRGYDLRHHLPALAGPAADDDARVASAPTIERRSPICCSTPSPPSGAAWARRHGALTRNQAHGSPGNLLDLYAATDIPETEGDHIRDSSGRHPRRTSRAGRWYQRKRRRGSASTSARRWRTSRTAVDLFFLAGINHIVYHGTAYSPAAEPYPGMAVLRGGRVQRAQPVVEAFPALNEYVARTQSFLQSGTPDHDVLVYYPFYESLAVPRPARLAHFGNANQRPKGRRIRGGGDVRCSSAGSRTTTSRIDN